MPKIRSRRRSAVFFSLLATACSRIDGPGASSESLVGIDTAVVDLEIGALDGTGPDVFSRITGLTMDEAGRIFVADYESSEIRVFGPDGGHLFTFGGDGSGPGRLIGPWFLTWGPDGLLWVRDTGNSRYSAFAVADNGAEFVELRQMAHTDYNNPAPITFTAAGELIDIGKHSTPDGESPITLFTLSEDSEVMRTTTLESPPPGELGMHLVSSPGFVRYFYQPFAPRHLLAYGPDGQRAVGIGSSYSIEWQRGADTVRIEGTAESPALTPEEKADGAAQLERDAQRAGITVGAFPYGVPDRKPPVRAITLDRADRLWVLVSRSAGQSQLADIWNAEGKIVARVDVPADIVLSLPASLDERTGLAVRRDSMGVEYVVRLRY